MADTQKKPRLFRVTNPGAAAVFFETTGQHEVPNPSLTYPEGHYMVREAPWLFSEEGMPADPQRRTEAPIERATRAPGEKRTSTSRRPVIPKDVPEGMGVRPDGAVRPVEPDQ